MAYVGMCSVEQVFKSSGDHDAHTRCSSELQQNYLKQVCVMKV